MELRMHGIVEWTFGGGLKLRYGQMVEPNIECGSLLAFWEVCSNVTTNFYICFYNFVLIYKSLNKLKPILTVFGWFKVPFETKHFQSAYHEVKLKPKPPDNAILVRINMHLNATNTITYPADGKSM